MKLAYALGLAAVLAAVQAGHAAPPDPALARRLCEASRRDAPAEARALCIPKEYATKARLQLYDAPAKASRENGAFLYTTTGARVMAWEPGPHEFTPEQRAYWLWIEWEGRVRMVPRKTLLAVPFTVEPALVIHPNAAVHGSTEAGPFQKRLGLGTVIQVTETPVAPDGSYANILIAIENGNPAGLISSHHVKRGVSSIDPPVARFVSQVSVTVRELPEQRAAAVRTAPYGTILNVYAGPPSIVRDGFLPVVEQGKVTGYVPASELSASAPTADELLQAVRQQLEAGEVAAAAGISEAAAKCHPVDASLASLWKAMNEPATAATSSTPLTIVLGPFAKLPAPPVLPLAWDAGTVEKDLSEHYASRRFRDAVASGRVLSRLRKNGMLPVRTGLALYFACRGDAARAREVTVDSGAPAPAGTDWCVAKVDLDGPCEPCWNPPMGYEPGEDSTDEEIAAGDAEVVAEHQRTHIQPVQAQVDRHEAWKRGFQKAAPLSPKLRIRFENLLDTAMQAQAAFLYHYTYSYPVQDQFSVGAGTRGPVQVRAIMVPPLEPGAQAELWVDVPGYAASVYGVAFAQDRQAARSMIEASPLPAPMISARPPEFRPMMAPQQAAGPAIPGEISMPFRACVCWVQ